MEIKGMEYKNGSMVIMDFAGEFFTCLGRPGTRQEKSGRLMPWYDEKMNKFVCGSEPARMVLLEMLSLTLMTCGRHIPSFVTECPLLGESVAGWEMTRMTGEPVQGSAGEIRHLSHAA